MIVICRSLNETVSIISLIVVLLAKQFHSSLESMKFVALSLFFDNAYMSFSTKRQKLGRLVLW